MRPQTLNWLILLLLALVWGSSFILIRKGLEGLTPMQVGSLRIFLAFLVLSPLLVWKRKAITRHNFKYIFLVGIFGSGIPPFLYAIAQTEIPSGVAGILNSTTPLFTLLLGVLLFGVRSHWLKFIGVLIGFAGAVLLLYNAVERPETSTFEFGALILLATACYGASVNIVKRYLQDVNALAITAYSFLCTGIPAGIYLFTSGIFPELSSDPATLASVGFVAILAFFGTALANILFFWFTKRTTALFASTVTYLIPFVAVMWGVYFGERIVWQHAAGLVMILIAVYIISRFGNKALKRRQAAS